MAYTAYNDENSGAIRNHGSLRLYSTFISFRMRRIQFRWTNTVQSSNNVRTLSENLGCQRQGKNKIEIKMLNFYLTSERRRAGRQLLIRFWCWKWIFQRIGRDWIGGHSKVIFNIAHFCSFAGQFKEILKLNLKRGVWEREREKRVELRILSKTKAEFH